jgi:hypothetical protein
MANFERAAFNLERSIPAVEFRSVMPHIVARLVSPAAEKFTMPKFSAECATKPVILCRQEPKRVVDAAEREIKCIAEAGLSSLAFPRQVCTKSAINSENTFSDAPWPSKRNAWKASRTSTHCGRVRERRVPLPVLAASTKK